MDKRIMYALSILDGNRQNYEESKLETDFCIYLGSQLMLQAVLGHEVHIRYNKQKQRHEILKF